MIPHPLNPFGFENEQKYLTFTAVEPGTVKITATGTPKVSALHYRFGTSGTWIPYTVGTSLSLNVNEKVQFWNNDTALNQGTTSYAQFEFSNLIKASGNCFSLQNFPSQASYYGFYYLFRNCTTLLTPPDISSVDRISTACFYRMFRGCSSLTKVPKMPKVVEMGHTTCREMFAGCTSLTTIPVDLLPATTLTAYCYREMFQGCTNLVNTPDLPSLSAPTSCYQNMFYGDINLVKAPDLHATTIGNDCYRQMFYGCSKLNSINVSFTDWNAEGTATANWLNDVSSTGTFTKPQALEEVRGGSRIPTGWTIINK